MPVTISYQGDDLPDFATLVAQGFDLKSPYRSTAPLLAYWRSHEVRATGFCQSLALDLAQPFAGTLHFELKFRPPAGEGPASQTDVMVESPGLALAVEAKYTEPVYETVCEWLGERATENRRTVLNSWLRTINAATGATLTIEAVANVTYQLIHRTASACSRDAQRCAVVYHCFDPSRSMLTYYQRQLATLATLIHKPYRITFILLVSTMTLTPHYMKLQAKWHEKPRPDLSDAVRAAILNDAVATFDDNVAFRC
jgi:hypothetical protein